jgi:putative transposase
MAGFCSTAFVNDACTKKIVGWAVSATMGVGDLPLKAFNYAVWLTNSESIRAGASFRPRIAIAIAGLYPTGWPSLGIASSVGPRGDSYDNALADAINAAYKTELINRGKPWRCIDDVELSTAQWVTWYNQERLHEALGYFPPAEYEAALTPHTLRVSQPRPSASE